MVEEYGHLLEKYAVVAIGLFQNQLMELMEHGFCLHENHEVKEDINQ